MLGTYFYPEFFSSIKDAAVREPLMRMASEINEDLEAFDRVLKNFGCEVIRSERPLGQFDVDNVYLPPLQVRNTHCVIGNTMYQFNGDYLNSVNEVLKNYCSNIVNLRKPNEEFYTASMSAVIKDNFNPNTNTWHSRSKYQVFKGADWPRYQDYVQGTRSTIPAIIEEMESLKEVLEYTQNNIGPMQGPNIINLKDRIILGTNEYCNYADWLSTKINDHRPISQFTIDAGHIDGCFAVLGHNVILGIDPLIDYQHYFPEYTVIKVPPESYQDQIKEFNVMKQKVSGVWWLAGEEHNHNLITYVESYLRPWLGYVAESIFDVNVLALDENTICVSNITPEIKTALKEHNIECIVVPWRHRFFVDGGLHCITLDLYRE
jgi:N-dimethylarginine dimethylaminohydrolase